jgi:alkylation response protein AidB-like acyl-CoA dehydrogenase
MAKLWTTELQGRVVDRCLQVFGGYGYMDEYPISRFYTAARVQRIYGGTSEIMREIVGRGIAS